MSLKNFVLLLLSLIISFACMASELSDKEKIATLYQQGKQVVAENPKQALAYGKQALQLAIFIDDAKSKGDSYHLIGWANAQQGKTKQALNYYLKALNNREIAGDLQGKAYTSHNIGVIFYNKEEYHHALKYYKQATKLHNQLNNKPLAAQTFQEISKTYIELKKYTLALKNLQDVLKYYEQNSVDNQKEIALTYHLIGWTLLNQRKYNQALSYFNKAVVINETLGNSYELSFHFLNMGIIHEKLQKYTDAISFYKKSAKYLEKSGYADDYSLTDTYNYIAKAYLVQNNTLLAIEYLKKGESLGLTSNNQSTLIECYQLMADVYRKQNDMQNVVASLDKSIAMSNEFYSDELIQKADAAELIRLENNFALLQQRKANQASLAVSHRNKQAFFVTFMALLGMCGVALLFYHRKNIFQRLNREKYYAVGAIAHDLRSPLSHIAGLLDILSLTKNEAEKEKYISLAKQRATQLNNLVEKTLDLNKLESGKVNINIERVALHALLQDLVEEYKKDAAKKQISISIDCPKEVFVQADASYLRQVYQNLLTNAIKFSPLGKHIMIALHENKDNKIQVVVKDEGPGLSKSDQKKLFQHFAKLSTKPTGSESSTGLGLTIAKKYVELMQGEIWCESEPGQGTSFITSFKQVA